jgi:hypothetical protein
VWAPYYRRVGGCYLCFTLSQGEEVFTTHPDLMFLLEDSGRKFCDAGAGGRDTACLSRGRRL